MRFPARRLVAVSIACAVAATACARDGGDDAATTTSPSIVLGTPAAADAAPVAPVTPVAPPEVDAAAYTVLDADTGSFLAEREADAQRAVASVTKLLTAYVVMQAGDPAHVVTVPPMQIDPRESVIGLSAGEQLDRKSTRLNSSHVRLSRMPSSA